ncbi:NACHT, LRR and PYD domains-containing protein 1 homolog [Seriola aureovittata]|uniref:NACHT, LRR and PYD domains-containing protein 1 homolog n=1 Tax=Seriola aureovittata TaxID=2871759 RepID=UPI0024BDC13E|nr:NACHT, LRR and PYD domains-containing protein 1 homolog [Seriola aureovittata]
MVDLMVERYGQRSVEVIREVLTDMNRTDLDQRLSETSLRLTGKHLTSLLQKDLTMTSVKEKLLETLEDLSYGEINEFKFVLQSPETTSGHPIIPKRQMKMAQRVDLVELMMQTYGERSVEVTNEVLKKINRSDLVQRLSEISSGSKGPLRSAELEGCGSTMQESSDWTKLEPEVNGTDADEDSTYSLQSEAGRFECSVSALRWVCKETVSLEYQFVSWEEHMERMKSMQYKPAGPLMNITVNAGKLDEVYLPHWICIDDNPTIINKFAALHMDDCGDVVEKVSEVTSSHVKLSEPVFSPRAALVKAGFRVKTKSYVLIYYKPNTPVLKLHVYVIPKDPALQKTVDKTEISDRYEKIRKPHPDKYLKMKQGYILTADINTADISPEELTLRHESDPNFYEVFIKNPDRDFYLTLSQSSTKQQVWSHKIQKDDYPNSGYLEAAGPSPGATGGNTVAESVCTDEHFVDKHQLRLIKRVTNIASILDELLDKKVINNEKWEEIRKMPTPDAKMREVYICMRAGDECKNIFFEILKRQEKLLIEDLQKKN